MTVNLFPNPALGAELGDWNSGVGRVAVTGFDRPFAYQGNGSCLVPPFAVVVAGTQYTFSISGRVGATTAMALYLDWLNSSGGLISGMSVFPSWPGGVVQRSSLTGVAPATTVNARLVVCNGADLVITMARCVPGTDATYADGETAGWVWDGARYSSTSRLAPPAAPPPGRYRRRRLRSLLVR